MRTPVVISNEEWNRLYMPQPRGKKVGDREGVPEHEAVPLPLQTHQVWTVSYTVFREVIAPNFVQAVIEAERLTGYDRSHLSIEMGAKQKDFPPEYIELTNGNSKPESNDRGLDHTALSGAKVQGSSKHRKNKVRSSKHRKSR